LQAVDAARLWRHLMELGAIRGPGEGVDRTSFSDAFQRGRAWLVQHFEEAGLEVWVDHAGNLHGRLDGEDDATLLLGGHSDTVPNGGMFDGALGVLSGLEIAATLAACGRRPRFSLEVVDFLAEESSAFGLSYIGSSGYVGELTSADLERRGPGGESLGDALRRVGGDPTAVGPVDPTKRLLGFMELHIEQGPILAREPGSLGVVTAITGIAWYRFRVQGRAGHAGTTPMRERRDALVAAGRLASRIYEAASAVTDLVATVGRLEVFPNAVNVVPERVEGVAEFRSPSADVLDRQSREIMRAALPPEVSLGCTLSFEMDGSTRPVTTSERLQGVIADAIAAAGARGVRLFSGAGHDAVEIARRTEVGMMFCPCRDGVSHSPAEWVEPDDVALALRAYDRAARQLLGA